jgi:ABC-type branched-subunit amino acid transport system ATPase component
MTTVATDHPDRPETEPLLSLRGLRKEFGGIVALDGVDLSVKAGEIIGIVGPNGAGKTTLFNCLMGQFEPTAGSVTLQGEDITDLPPPAIVERGIARTFQIPRVFPNLSVHENMEIYQPHRDESLFATLVRRTDSVTNDRIDDLLSFVGLDDMADVGAGTLSTGQQKLLNIAEGLLKEPDIILLDEPAAGVNPALVEEIMNLILELGNEGQTFVIIEHDMDVVREVTEFVYVLANGTNLTEGPPESVLNDQRVLEAYFGE